MPPDRSPLGSGPAATLVRYLGGAVALVVVVTAAFWGVGRASDDEGGRSTDQPTVAAGEETSTAPAGTPTGAGPATSGSPSPAGTTQESPGPAATAPAPAATSDSQASLPRGEISIQVLDAVLDDDGAAAQAVADELEAAGYDVVVVNKASKVYDVTTAFWSGGQEAAARQVAEEFGFQRVDAKPDNLSDSVRVHVVVGRDRA